MTNQYSEHTISRLGIRAVLVHSPEIFWFAPRPLLSWPWRYFATNKQVSFDSERIGAI